MASSTTTGSETTTDPNDIDFEPAAAATATEYMTVREVLDKHSEQVVLHKINIYGVITYLPSGALRKESKCTQVTIVDQTCEPNERLKLNVFATPFERQLRDSCEIGDIIRFHRLKVQDYNGRAQGVHVAKFSSWIRFKRVPNINSPKKTTTTTTRTRSSDHPRTSAAAAADDNDDNDDEMEIDHILNSPEFEFVGNKTNNTILEKDLKIIRELRKWLETNPQLDALIEAGLSTPTSGYLDLPSNPVVMSVNTATAGGPLTSPTNNSGFNSNNRLGNSNLSPIRCRVVKLGDIQREGFYDVVCQICAIGEHQGARFLIVWDGTKSDQGFYQESQFHLVNEGGLFAPELLSYVYQVFLFDEFIIGSDALRSGDFILLKNMNVRYARINSQVDMIMKMPGQTPQGLKYGRKIQQIPPPAEADVDSISENDIDNRVRAIWKKGKEIKVTMVNEVEFIREFTKIVDDNSMDATLNELIQKNNANTRNQPLQQQQQPPAPKPPSLLVQVNQLLADEENAYQNSQQVVHQSMVTRSAAAAQLVNPVFSVAGVATAANNRNSSRSPPRKSLNRPANATTSRSGVNNEICDEIWRLKRLVKMTYLIPMITQSKLGELAHLRFKYEPYFASLRDLSDEASSQTYMRCKVTAKLFRHAINTSPVIANVFVCCKKCGYVNFVPFHLANIYQSATLNMILRQQMDEMASTQGMSQTQMTQNTYDPARLARNFSLEWLKTAMPVDSIELAATQQQQDDEDESTQTYEYACPRCEMESSNNGDDSPPNPLSYIYRIWLVLRDANSELTPCLLEADSAAAFLAPVDPLKFFTSPVKAHQVYKTIQAGFDRKYLFTIDTFRMNSDVDGGESESEQSRRTVPVLYKIVDMVEISGSC